MPPRTRHSVFGRHLATRCVLVTLVALAGSFSPSLPHARASEETLKTFDACWRIVKQRFYDRALNHVDWDEARRRYRPQADRAQPGRELREVLKAMLSELESSHTTVLHPQVFRTLRAELRNERSWTFGIQLEETIPGFYFVRALYEGGPAQNAGLLRGDRIVLVDGVSPDRSDRVVDAGYDPGLRGARLWWILPGPHADVEVVVQSHRRASSRRTVTLRALRMNAVDATENSVSVIDHEQARVGYIHVWFCSWGVTNVLERGLTGALKSCDALILDLRGRGGHPRVVHEILQVFAPRDGLVDRILARREAPLWKKPVVFLLDNRSRSAKEVLAFLAREDGVGPLVGERTEGAVLGARFFRLPDGSYIEVPTADFTVRGVRLEGKGVVPDHRVDCDLPFRNGHDPILERGVRVAVEATAKEISLE